MAQDMRVEFRAEATAAAKHVGLLDVGALDVEVVTTLRRPCHTLAVGLATIHRRRHTSMLAGAQVSSVYFRFQQRPDPITAFVSQFRFVWGFSCCCPFLYYLLTPGT